MELILKQTVESLGEEGDIVKVKPGYARNYLIPKNLGVIADKVNLANLEQERAAIDARRAKVKEAAETLSKKITGTVITIEQRVGDEDRLFGSVTSSDIAKKLADIGIEIEKKHILLSEPIKTLGELTLPVKVGYQMTADIIVQVVPLEEKEVETEVETEVAEETQE